MANMTFKTNLLPQTNLGYNLGSSDLKWKFIGDGSGITNISTLGLTRPKNLNGTNDVTIQTLINDNRANRLAFLPADQIIIEKTTDGGTTWIDAGVADSTKTGLFSQTRSSVAIPLLNGNINTQCGIRITITAMKYNVPANTAETQKYNYWNSSYVLSAERYCQLKEMYFWVSSLNNAIKLKVERATGANPNNWATIFENNSFGLTGWSGNDYISFPQSTFGGGTTQTGNYWNYRLTFFTIGPNGSSTLTSGYLTSAQSVAEIRGYGDTWWTPGSNLASKDHMYSWDYQQNVTFPKGVTATTFNGALNGNAASATKLSTSGTTGQFWRGDNSWSNTLVGPLKIGSADAVANTGYATDNVGSQNYIAFYGVYGDNPGGYNHTYIGESIYGSKTSANEQSELLLFHGNDPAASSGPDRIRLFAGQVDIQAYASATNGTWDAIRSTIGTQIANFKNGVVTITGNCNPEADNTRSLGISGTRWANAYITTTHGALDGNAATATKIYVTNTTPTSTTTYYPVYTNSTTSGNQDLRNNARFYYYDTGTTSYVNIGNASNSGGLTLHNANGKYVDIVTSAFSANRTITLPDKAGTIALTSDLSDTKNTAGSTDTSSKIFLIGATSQAANPQTYSDNEVYATNGQFDAKSMRINEHVTLQYNTATYALDFIFV